MQFVKPDAAPIGPAAEQMCRALMSLVICRLDDKNGSVPCGGLLPKECMLEIPTECSNAQRAQERTAILRLAVDWCSKPCANDEILAVMRKVRLVCRRGH